MDEGKTIPSFCYCMLYAVWCTWPHWSILLQLSVLAPESDHGFPMDCLPILFLAIQILPYVDGDLGWTATFFDRGPMTIVIPYPDLCFMIFFYLTTRKLACIRTAVLHKAKRITMMNHLSHATLLLLCFILLKKHETVGTRTHVMHLRSWNITIT